ncbi:MAG: hypothetical protein RIC55_20660 [Pirellulaceae bacterium]
MLRILLLTVALQACCASLTSAEDYLLRLDEVGYPKTLVADMPRDLLLHRLEVVARPDAPFRVKVEGGGQVRTFEGTLRAKDDGAFVVDLFYRRAIDSGGFSVNASGEKVRSFLETSTRTTVGLSLNGAARRLAGGVTSYLDEQAVVGGKVADLSEDRVRSREKLEFVITLLRYPPEED